MDLMQKEKILEEYCLNDMLKLKQICYPKICKIGGISYMDYDDLYSIALDVLRDSVEKYDDLQNCKFSTFLSNNITNKFDTYISYMNRKKRKCPVKMEYLDELIEENVSLGEKIPSNFTIENELSDKIICSIDDFSDKMKKYLSRLSKLQVKIAMLLSEGYNQQEIMEELHISNTVYTDNMHTMRAYDKIRILY